jgi:hypothetical protein
MIAPPNRLSLRLLSTFLLLCLVCAAPASAGVEGNTASGTWEVTDRQGVFIEGELISLSPDGRWIAGIDMDNTFCVWEVAIKAAQCDGTDLSIDVDSVRWSPDSTAVAFSSGPLAYGIDSDIHVYDRVTGILTNLTDDNYEGPLIVDRDEVESAFLDLYPTWSADGQSLTFIRSDLTTTAPLFTTELVTISRTGGESVQRFMMRNSQAITMTTPIFSLRDGSLLYTVTIFDEADPDSGIWLLKPAGEPRQLLSSMRDNVGLARMIRVSETEDTATVSTIGIDPATGDDLPLLLDVMTGTVKRVDNVVLGFSPDGESMLTWVENANGTETLTITDATGGVTEVHAGQDLSRGGWRGYDWATNNTILVPIFKAPYNDGGGLLVTVQRAGEATPVVGELTSVRNHLWG